MIPVPNESTLAESSGSSSSNSFSLKGSVDENRRFNGLRSVKWRINLGILPSSSSSPSSIDDLRRVTADSRRRYAGLRRRLLVDPHILKKGNSSSDVVIDNPLSQNPDSTWGRFFRNAELEKMVDQDLSRLYPEHGSYFQTPGCQGMLRRILLLWCLRHSEFGYRQGMHELLAPLLYVLHVDVERLSHVRTVYEDHFMDKFDGLSFQDNDTYNFDYRRSSDYTEDNIDSHENVSKARSLNELDPEIQTIILLSDPYGAEGELGIVISEKFMEHDAYCLFDALMNGANGAVAMAEFFSPSPARESQSGLPPVIEASAALYHLLLFVDPSLHSHLVELGVEPQYFALRWLRVLFGREFSLGGLLTIWDEIFASENKKLEKSGEDDGGSYGVLCSSRGAFISAVAVSMLLHLRSSLLGTEHATSCLQRLLNFPENVDLKKLLEKAKSLQTLALNSNISSSSSYNGTFNHSKSMVVRGSSESIDSSPTSPLNLVSVSYWEEKWRVHHREEELRKDSLKKNVPTQKKGWTDKVKLRLSRTESDPCPSNFVKSKKNPKPSVRRRLLEDLSRELGLEDDMGNVGSHEVSGNTDIISAEVEHSREDGFCQEIVCISEDRCSSGNAGSEENSSIFSDPTSPHSETNDHENDSEKSSVASNLSLDENDEHAQNISEDSPLPISHPPEVVSQKSECKNDSLGNPVTELKEKKPISGKFQWFWKFGRNPTIEGMSEKGGNSEATKSASEESHQKTSTVSEDDGSGNWESTKSGKGDVVDQNVMGTLKNLGHSMLEHIQVIESVFQQDRATQAGSLENFSKNILVGKGQVTAMAALKELRKISNLLSEM
ncbi:uncharacterized protein LOC115724878 [Cannabis sativa]|uniref:Rab-GAP TBC domain-containing protein n=1 Tax=Cannabis sativa TaxID=3483 RepID=A0A803Q836_CANSA|nr:uncharacterized protein LOC115724878 [Cannabis sativa]XP_030510104.1 uncharacterized protein LOC115724878 [Cannabis sativa]